MKRNTNKDIEDINTQMVLEVLDGGTDLFSIQSHTLQLMLLTHFISL